MSSPLSRADILYQFIESRINELHTQLPCKVTYVDYSNCLVNVQPLLRDARSEDKLQKYPEIQDVPIAVYSAAGNTARITLPIKVGDVGVVHFSEQESGSFVHGDGSTITDPEEYAQMGLYPLYYECGINPITLASKISDSNVLIENGSTYIEIEPSGKITAVATQLVANISGSITMNSPVTNINSATTNISGDVNIGKDCNITKNNTVGGITSTAGFACSGTVGGTATFNGDLNIQGISYIGHTHTQTDPTTQTSSPNGGTG